MTNHDVTVAASSDETSEERPDRSLAEQLVEQARADGRSLDPHGRIRPNVESARVSKNPGS